MNQNRVEQLYKEGKYQEAWWAYTALTARGEASADVHQWGAMAAHGLGHLHSALYAMEQGMAVATGDDVGRVRYKHAVFQMGVGRYEQAIAELHQWIADLPLYPALETTHLALVYYHLGLACRQLERYADSMRHYVVACDLLRASDQREYLRRALQNLAWVACLANDEGKATDALDHSEALCDTDDARWQQKIGRAFLEAISRNGDLHNVMTLCQTIIQADGDLPMDVRSHAYWLAGRVAMELNLAETARVMGEQALWFGAAVGDDRCLSDAARLIAEIDRRFVPTA